MHVLEIIASLMVLCGALFMSVAIFLGEKTRENIPHEVRRRWRVMLVLMVFFLTGYLAFVALLVSRLQLPSELVTGTVFLGGAIFVYIVINLSRDSITRIRTAENNLRELNATLENRITERTVELQRSREFLKTVLDSLSDSVVILNAENYRIMGVNAPFLREYGVREENVIGKTCYEVTHNRTEICVPPSDPCPMGETLKTGRPRVSEHIHYAPDEKKIYAEISTFPIKDDSGAVIQVVHVARDITERKNAENMLLHSRQTLQTILSSMPYGVVIIGKDKKIRMINEAALTLMKSDSEKDILGMTCNHTLCPAQEGKCPILDLHEKLDRSEKILIAKDGQRIPILKTVVPVEINGESVLLEAFINITERKNAEERLKTYSEELEQINEEMKNFTYTVSHDLRAPLLNIIGFSEEFKYTIREGREFLSKYVPLLKEEDKKKYSDIFEHDMTEAVEFIKASVSRMDSLIEGILNLSRLGRSELKPEPVHTEQLVHSLLKTLQHQIESRRARVQLGPLPDLIIDRTAIERIFGNLLDNALKYLKPSRPGEIAITAEQKDGVVHFAFRDNGRGIAPDDIKKVFDPFRRVGKQDVPGDGMGLSYVRTLVKRLGGRIWCESDLDRGSCFRFTVPVNPAGN